MLLIPLLYFIGLGIYFYKKQQCWNIDIAAVSLLVFISFFAILIDVNDIYGMYGINENYITLPSILLYCIQWTIILLPIHYIANLPIEKHPEVKTKLLYILAIIISNCVTSLGSLPSISAFFLNSPLKPIFLY